MVSGTHWGKWQHTFPQGRHLFLLFFLEYLVELSPQTAAGVGNSTSVAGVHRVNLSDHLVYYR